MKSDMKKIYNAIFVLFAAALAAGCDGGSMDIVLEDLKIVPDKVTMVLGESSLLELEFTPETIEDKSAEWNSSNTGVVSVDGQGNITANSTGTAVVTAISCGVMATCEVTVVSGPVESIVLNQTELSLVPGESFQLEATFVPEDGQISSLLWESTDDAVAVVDQNGLVMAKADGKAEIHVSAGDIKAVCTVNVLTKAKAGDYFYSDGTWSSELDESKTLIGIVFWTGNPAIDDALLSEEHPDCVNGLVVSIYEGKDLYQPGSRDYYNATKNKFIQDWLTVNAPEYESIKTEGIAMGDAGNKMLGYNNTKALIAFNEAKENSEWTLNPIVDLLRFREENPLPSNTSGWYMPSVKELFLISEGDNLSTNIFWGIRQLANKKLLNEALSKVDGAKTIGDDNNSYYSYWSSTEYKMQGTMCFLDMNLASVVAGGNPIDVTSNYYRFVFAF